MGTDMEVIDVDAERGPPPSFREATAPPPAEAEAEAAAGEGAAGVEDDAEAEAEVEVVEEVVTMEDHGDDEDLAKLKGAGGGSVLLLAASTGAEENVVGDEAWAPWKTDRDFENEKQQKEFEELIERTGGIVDSRHALCCVHGKQRLISLMARMPGPREMYRCSQDSICAGGEARRREAAATAKTGGGGGGDDPTTPAAAGGGTKRYFGGMKEMMFKKRSWRKVCWECGIGEHEKYQCPNRICPTTGQVGKPPARGPGATLVVKWTPSMHLLSTADMSGSECAVCGKQGQVNCCSAQLSTTPSCARCLEKGHTFDECIVNQNTNYGGRPGGAGGQYQQQAPRPRRPPSTVSLPPYQPAPEASQTAVMRPEMVEGMRLASAPSRGYHSGGFGGGGKGGGKGGFGGGGGGGGGPGGYGRPPPAHYQQQHHPPARGHQGYPTQPTHHAAGSGHHRAPPPAYYQQAPPQRYDPYPQQWHGERDRHPPRQHHGKGGAYHHGGGKGSGGGKGGGGGKARYPY